MKKIFLVLALLMALPAPLTLTRLAHAAYDPNAINQLTGDVTATGNNTGSSVATVQDVGGSTAASVGAAAVAVGTATSADTPNTLVKRDGSGNFAAGTITAGLVGNASTATAFAATPSACPGGQFAISQAANGNFTCATVPSGTQWGAPSCTVTITGSATLAPTTCILLVNASGGAVAVTLEAASAAIQATSIKKIDATANTVTITPPTGTIDSVSNYVITQPNAAITVTSDLTNYWIQ